MTQRDDSRQREQIRCAPATARLLIEAGPGTGKTQMAAHRIAGLIQAGISPGQLLVLSFSRSAVRNLTQRLIDLSDADDGVLEELRYISIRTFDSWAFRILRISGRPVQQLLASGHDKNIEELTGLIKGEEREKIRKIISNRLCLIVDEFQDLPGVRGELVLALLEFIAPPGKMGTGFTVLGDPAQAIYGFAAASNERKFPTSAEYWNTIRNSYGSELKVLSLTKNYRANTPLAELSSSLRSVLLSKRSDTEKLEIVQQAVTTLPFSAEPVGPSWLNEAESRSRAILTRTNGESVRVLKDLFGRETKGGHTPVRLRAGNHASLPPAWIAALLSRLKSQHLPKSQFSRIYSSLTNAWDDNTSRSLNLPSEAATWSRLCKASNTPDGATNIQIPDLRPRLNWPDSFPDDQVAGEDGLVVTTIHQSKGLEFDIVTILDSPRSKGENTESEDEIRNASGLEEANVNYVAITRAGSKLDRIEETRNFYNVPRTRKFSHERERLQYWRNKWVNLEMGLKGDIDPFGFVDSSLHGGTDSVASLQNLLMRNASSLLGHKVMLVKQNYNGKALWHVHLQEDDRPEQLIGRTAPQLTYDLLDILHSRGYMLPKRIFNLRIAAVGTISSEDEFQLEEPYRTSKLWLGVSLFGTGDFKSYKRKW